MIFLNSFTLLQMDRLQLTAWSTVTDGGCKYHTSNDVFPRCKTCAEESTGKSYDELLQSDNKMRIGTRSGKPQIIYGLVTKHNANANDDINACVELHDTDTNDNIHAWHRTMRSLTTTDHPLNVSAHSLS